MSMLKNILQTVVLLTVMFALVEVFADSMDLPIVQKDQITKECVKVIGAGSCENLPDRYVEEFVPTGELKARLDKIYQ